MHSRCMTPQRGAATLAVVTGLLLVMILTAAALQRGLVFEQKASTNQYRALQAQEAAEAGLEWTLAQLNAGRIDDQCRPAADGPSLRERALKYAAVQTGSFEPGFELARSGAPACRHTADGWRCLCPSRGKAVLPAMQDHALHPGFAVELSGAETGATGGLAGAMKLTAQGCAHMASDACADSRTGEPGHAVATVRVALLPALAALPAAPLVAAGDVELGADGAGLHNPDAASGLLVHAGGTVLHAEQARLSPPPGTPATAALAELDQPLAGRTPDRLLLQHTGLPRTAFEHLPSLVTLDCSTDCGTRLREAVARGLHMFRVTGDLALRDVELGSAAEPVLLVADGEIRLGAGVHFTGVLFGRSLQWQAGHDGRDHLRGAAIVAGSVSLSGTPDFIRDADVLNLLHTRTGTFVRVPGSWKDAL